MGRRGCQPGCSGHSTTALVEQQRAHCIACILRCPTPSLVGTPIYTAIEIGELLVILMLVDAAFSGDWSRIGAISKDTELALQKVCAFVCVAHLGTAVAAGVLASRKGKSPLLPALKGFLFGALGVYEEQHSKA